MALWPFGRKEPSTSLSPEVQRIFGKVHRFLDDETAQNNALPEDLRRNSCGGPLLRPHTKCFWRVWPNAYQSDPRQWSRWRTYLFVGIRDVRRRRNCISSTGCPRRGRRVRGRVGGWPLLGRALSVSVLPSQIEACAFRLSHNDRRGAATCSFSGHDIARRWLSEGYLLSGDGMHEAYDRHATWRLPTKGHRGAE